MSGNYKYYFMYEIHFKQIKNFNTKATQIEITVLFFITNYRINLLIKTEILYIRVFENEIVLITSFIVLLV